MPGINQLKKFLENIDSIGDEQNVRSKRGEPFFPLSIPETVKDVDDADDFLYGFADPNSTGQVDSFGDVNPETMNPEDLNLDYLLPNSSSTSNVIEEDELEELSSLDDEIPTSEPSFSLPEEDISLDALNDFMESEGSDFSENPETLENTDNFENFSVPETFDSTEENISDFEQPDISENLDFSTNDSFDFSENSDLQDIPDSIPENITPLEAFNFPEDLNDVQDETSESFSALGNLDSLGEIENFDNEFDSDDEFSSGISDDLANDFANNFSTPESVPDLDNFSNSVDFGELEELEEVGELEELDVADELDSAQLENDFGQIPSDSSFGMEDFSSIDEN